MSRILTGMSLLDPSQTLSYLLNGVILTGMGYALLRRWRRLYDEDRERAIHLMMMPRGSPGRFGLVLFVIGIALLALGIVSALMG